MAYYVFVFLVGGAITAAITYFELSGAPLISRLAALFPVFTWLSYIFIGQIEGAEAVSKHALFVLLGTIFSWVPYMFAIYYFSPKLGSIRAIILAIAVFLIVALIFIKLYRF